MELEREQDKFRFKFKDLFEDQEVVEWRRLQIIHLKGYSAMIKYRCMSLYVPYSGQSPAAITINGHRLIILAQNKEMLQAELGLLNADRLQAIDLPAGEAQRSAIDDISRAIHGGVVIAPANVQLQEIIKSLEGELPWVQ